MQNDKKKISMIDIAEMSGVSIATVSRVLNQNGRYGKETEKRVLDIVNKYGYQVNQSAKALRTNKTQSIGVFVPDITNEFFAKIVRSIQNELILRDYTVIVCDSNESEEMENIQIENLVAKDIEGIIYISGKRVVKKVYESYKIPAIYIDRSPKNAGPLVSSDNQKGGYLATKELIEAGCKNIVFLKDERSLWPIRQRLRGYKKALKEYGIKFEEKYLINTYVDYNKAKYEIDKAIKSNLQFDGIFACNDIVGLGAMHALSDNNIKVPEQVKIVGFDNMTISKVCNPPMTTISQNTEEMGKIAVERLFDLFKNNGNINRTDIIDVEIKRRKTV